tara:strand:+ start:340 stop:849 length:510 start_codon:yes stop_codon:yes gene_type:complete
MKTVPIPPYLKDYAHDLTLLRIQENKDRYQGTHKQRKGYKESVLLGSVSREYYTEYVGILGELLVRHYLEMSPDVVVYTVSSLFKRGGNVSDDSDIIVESVSKQYRLSVKTCEGSYKANKQAIDTEKPEIILFVKFISPHEYIMANFTLDQVRSWRVTTGAYSPYYELE